MYEIWLLVKFIMKFYTKKILIEINLHIFYMVYQLFLNIHPNPQSRFHLLESIFLHLLATILYMQLNFYVLNIFFLLIIHNFLLNGVKFFKFQDQCPSIASLYLLIYQMVSIIHITIMDILSLFSIQDLFYLYIYLLYDLMVLYYSFYF